MKRTIAKYISTTVFLLFVCQASYAQISPKELQNSWERMTKMVVKSVEAMPAENFEYVPAAPLRDFASQIGHTTGANYLFAGVVKLKRPESMPTSDTKEKKQVIKELKASFDFISNGIKSLTPNDLNENIDWFGSKMSRMQAILTMTDHLQREHGKTILYLRLKGITPAQSAGW